jgi:chromate reductase, NAD(P)H dehydrogenase (quinone)
MAAPKILVLAGSTRTGSHNARLAGLAAKALVHANAEVTTLSLADYPMPIYDGDLEAQGGPPVNAGKLARQFCAHHGVFITSPEYNASLTPLLKNTIDWISRVREGNAPPLAAFKGRAFAIGAASNGSYGGMRSLIALRHVLELGCGALVIPEQIAVRQASQAFDHAGNLRDEQSANLFRLVLARLIELAQRLA